MTDQRNGGISWCDETWNPVRGCSRVSEGCRNCYAETMAARFAGPGQPYERLVTDKGRWNGTVRLVPEHLADPIRWQRRRRVFVNSMSDLFHPSVSNEVRAAIFGVMAAAPRHTFQVLTKRPERAAAWFDWLTGLRGPNGHVAPCDPVMACIMQAAGHGLTAEMTAAYQLPTPAWPLPNVWLGVSVEDQAAANKRIPELLRCPAAVRWVSAEPLLGPLDLTDIVLDGVEHWNTLDAREAADAAENDGVGGVLDWVVVGGESGPGARPMHPDWARSLRDQCAAAGVPFHFKQWGEWADLGDAHSDEMINRQRRDSERVVNLAGGHGFHGDSPRVMRRVGKKTAGRLLDGVLHDAYPEKTP